MGAPWLTMAVTGCWGHCCAVSVSTGQKDGCAKHVTSLGPGYLGKGKRGRGQP